jgi:hypothetical protein
MIKSFIRYLNEISDELYLDSGRRLRRELTLVGLHNELGRVSCFNLENHVLIRPVVEINLTIELSLSIGLVSENNINWIDSDKSFPFCTLATLIIRSCHFNSRLIQ